MKAGVDPELVRGVTLYEAKGCEECNNTGYRGRSAIVELLELNDQIRDLIIGKVTGHPAQTGRPRGGGRFSARFGRGKIDRR